MKTTKTSDSGNSALTASGAGASANSSTTFVHTLPQVGGEPHSRARVSIGGTFTGATLKIEGLQPSGAQWCPLLLIAVDGTRGTSASPTDSTNASYVVDCAGFGTLRVYNSAGTITSMVVEVTSGTDKEIPAPIVNNVSTTSGTFSAGTSFTGGTGTNTVSIPDNLASAWSLTESTNKYIEAITTNSSEAVKLWQNVVLVDGKTITNSANTTGTSIWGASDKGAFFGATPVVKQSTYTQTYSTAAATVPAATTHTITDNTAGTPSTSALAALSSGTTYSSDVGAIRNNFATLGAELALANADILALKKVVNNIIDNLQAYGLVG